MAALLQFGKRETAGNNYMMLIHHFVAFAVEKDPPVPREAFAFRMLVANARRAVGSDGIIPARFIPQIVNRTNVLEETFASFLRWNGGTIEINIFSFAIVCADPDHIAFV